MYSRHEEFSAIVQASVEQVFERLDDQTHLTEHMSKPSWKMGWGKMDTVLDAMYGRAVGSHIVLKGQVLGIQLYLDEVVTLREPPFKKTWETVGEPRLLVIGSYLMGFDLKRELNTAQLRVTIDYQLPGKGIPHWLGRLFGRSYAKWCTRQMVWDAQLSFTRHPENIEVRTEKEFR